MSRQLYETKRPVIFVIFIINAYVCDANNLQHDVGILQDDHNDVIFSDRLLWTVTSSGKAGCAVSCMKDRRCLSFTVAGRNKNTRKTECRGYDSTGENMAGSGTPSPGARSYLLLARANRAQTTTPPPTSSLALTTEESMTSLALTTEESMTSLALTTEESMTSLALTTEESMTSLATTTEESMTSLATTTEESMTSLATTAEESMTSLATTTEESMTSLATTTEESMTSLATTTEESMTSLATTIEESMTSLATTTEESMTSLATTTEESMTSLATTAEESMMSLAMTTEESMTSELSSPTTKRQRRREEPPTPTTPPAAAQRPANAMMQIPGSPAQCTGNLECAKGPYRECFERKCLCTPGYFYSLSQQGCVIDCQEEKFQRLVMEYPFWYIEGNNYYSLVTPTLRECMERCFDDPTCRSMGYRFTSGQCSHSMYTPLDVPDMWKKSSSDDPFHYYQKLCA